MDRPGVNKAAVSDGTGTGSGQQPSEEATGCSPSGASSSSAAGAARSRPTTDRNSRFFRPTPTRSKGFVTGTGPARKGP